MSEWKEKYFDDFSILNYGDNLPSTALKPYGYRVFGANGFICFNDKFNLEKQTVLISCRGENSGTINLVPEKTFVTNNSIPVVIKTKDVDTIFLFYKLQTIRRDQIVSGSAQPQVTINDLKKIKITFPFISEQRQIATILSTADAVIEKTQAAIAKYKAIKQGMLQDLFTRGIDTASGKLRPSYQDAPKFYKESKLGWIPKEWSEEIFGEQIELVHGHQFRNYDFTEFGVAVVKIGQVKPENVDLSNCSFVSADRMEEFRNETIRNGDVLMALTGATLGKACLVSGLSNPVLQNYRVGRFEPKIKENDIDKSFLYYTLTAGELLNQIFNKVNSGAQGNIGKADFEKALFKKPPFTEQKLIAERLNTLNQKLQTEQDFLHKQQQIKAGLMNDLLSGKKLVAVQEESLTQTEN
jgi:type I restriction enzyme S subunit